MITNKKPTLCWDCEKATGGCSWSDHWKHEPVDGWTATQCDLQAKGIIITSYIVEKCPEFERDAKGFGQFRIRRAE